jgi:hypothetical protein
MNKINKILLGVTIVLVVALIAVMCWWYFYRGSSNYYAVYLDTGDLYFGKLSTFPNMTLSDVWYLQRDSQGNSSLSEFIKTPWGPEGSININRDRIVWTAKLSDVSQLIPYIKNKTSQVNNQSGGQVPENISTSTTK